jgi:hypothetical protein
MSNVYGVKLGDGSSYEVTTERHHSQHDGQTWKKHLLDVIKGSVSGIVSAVIVE